MKKFSVVNFQAGFVVLLGLVWLSLVVPTELLAEHPPMDQRSIGDYRRDVKTFMKLSKSDDQPTQRSAVFNLCALHFELVNDSRFRSSPQVQSFRVVVANRLEAYANDVTKQLKKERAAGRKSEKSSQLSGRSQVVDSKSENLESILSTDDLEQEETDAIYQSALQSYGSLAQLSGGPAQVFDYAGGRMGGSPWDHGHLLVNLIQNTIDPAFWRDNGGNGTIHYYQPSRVLVINGSQRIHEMTEDLLWKLRAAN